MVELVIFTVFCAIAWCSIERTFDITIVAGMESINVKKIIALEECDDDDDDKWCDVMFDTQLS